MEIKKLKPEEFSEARKKAMAEIEQKKKQDKEENKMSEKNKTIEPKVTPKKVEPKKNGNTKPIGRKGSGLIEKIKEQFKSGEKDLEKVAKKTGANINTVRTQFYKLGYKTGTKRGRKKTT